MQLLKHGAFTNVQDKVYQNINCLITLTKDVLFQQIFGLIRVSHQPLCSTYYSGVTPDSYFCFHYCISVNYNYNNNNVYTSMFAHNQMKGYRE